MTAGTIWSSADPWPGTRTQPRGAAHAGTVAVSERRPGATVAATGSTALSHPPPAFGRRVSNSTCTLEKPWLVMVCTSGGMTISIT